MFTLLHCREDLRQPAALHHQPSSTFYALLYDADYLES